MKKNNIVSFLLVALIVVGVFIPSQLFYTAPSIDYIVYRSAIGVDEQQQKYVKRNLGLKDKFKDNEKYDEDYANILALNNEKTLSFAATQCDVPTTLKPYNRKVTIRRQKSFSYFYIVFDGGLELYSECILREFNSFLANGQIEKYSLIISDLQKNRIGSQFKDINSFLNANLEYYKTLSYMLKSNNEVYSFIQLSNEHEPDNEKEFMLRLFLAANMILALIFLRLLVTRKKYSEQV